MSQRAAAKVLNMGTGSAVCKQLALLAVKLEADGRLREQLAGLEAKLESARVGQPASPAFSDRPNSILDSAEKPLTDDTQVVLPIAKTRLLPVFWRAGLRPDRPLRTFSAESILKG